MEYPSLKASWLLALKAVYDHKSFSEAAKALGYTEAYVSKQLAKLQETTNVELLQQDGRSKKFTRAGLELLVYANRLYTALEDAEQTIFALQEGVHMPIQVVANNIVGSYILPSIVGAFCRQHAGMGVALNLVNVPTAHKHLLEGRADLAITQVAGLDKSRLVDLEIVPFGRTELIIIAAPDHHLALAGPLRLKDLEQEQFLLRESGSSLRMDMERIFAAHSLAIRPAMELSDTMAIKHSVMANLGLAIMLRAAVEAELKAGTLVTLDVADFPIPRQWFMIRLTKGYRPRSAEMLWTFLLKYRGKSS